jgi:hypothetical protein
MSNQLEDVDLTGDALYICHVHDALFLEHLHRDLFSGEDVRAELHLPEGALADGLTKDVVSDRLGVVSLAL